MRLYATTPPPVGGVVAKRLLTKAEICQDSLVYCKLNIALLNIAGSLLNDETRSTRWNFAEKIKSAPPREM